MLIDRILCPVTALGPGERVVIWTMGCRRRCPGCIAPELRSFDPAHDMPITRILDCLDACLDCPDDLRRTERSMGLTISGGEPMDQADELCRLLKHARTRFDDILVYTGYTLEELEACLPEDRLAFLKEHIDVLIDGPYIASLNNGKAVLRGSTNQTIRFLNPDMRCRYEHYLAGERDIQNLFVNDRLHSIGIQSPAGP